MDLFQSNNTFWSVLESDLCEIPEYIKNILSFCNFGNVLSLQKFDKQDVNKMEQIVQEHYKNWLSEKMDGIELLDYFGPIYEKKPEKFIFTCGDVKMIEQIAEYVRSTVQKKGYAHFRGVKSQCLQITEGDETKTNYADVTELQEKLYVGVSNLLEPYGKDVVSLFKMEMVMVTMDNGTISGRVRCVLCDNAHETGAKKKKGQTEFYSQFWKGNRWCLSNFDSHHLRKKHPINSDANRKAYTNKVSSQSTSNVDDLKNNSNDGGIGAYTSNETDDTSLVEIKFEPLNTDVNNEFDVELNNLRAQLKFHNLQMRNNIFLNKEKTTEFDIAPNPGQISKIEVSQIPGDGNCLFGAAVHQLFHLEISSDEYKQRTTELRNEVVEHIKTHLEHYERKLLDRIHQKRHGEKKILDVEEECRKFLDNYLSKESRWGGSESIQAISELFESNVIVFNSRGDFYFGSTFNSSYKNIITLAFSASGQSSREDVASDMELNHFDSIVKLSDDVINKATSMVMAKYALTCSLKDFNDIIELE